MTAAVRADDHPAGLERIAYYTFLAFVAALQLSIAASEILLACSGVLWLLLLGGWIIRLGRLGLHDVRWSRDRRWRPLFACGRRQQGRRCTRNWAGG